MIILLIGLVCFLAAVRVTAGLGSAPSDGPPSADVRGAGAAAWVGLLAVLTLAQLWLGADRLDRYRFGLLGFRYRVAGMGGQVVAPPVVVSGDAEAADLYVPGAGDRPVLELRPVGQDSLLSVDAVGLADAGAVGLVEEPGLLGTEWRVLGAVPMGTGTSVRVLGPAGVWTVGLGAVDATIDFVDARLPLPWIEQPVARVRPPSGAPESPVVLPPLETSLIDRLRGVRPSVFQRTYPLADVLEAAAPDAALPPLGSFFFWHDDGLHLAVLDSEVEVDAPPTGPAPVWSGGDGGRRVLVAGLPYRDYPEPDLTLPERYGLRPLRSWRLEVNGPWLDVAMASPEVTTLDRSALEELALPGGRDEEGRLVHRIRLTPGRDALARRSVVFDAAPSSFAAAGQAVFRLPLEPTEGALDVLTPSGLTRWDSGRPLALGAGDRALLVRVDGLGTSTVFWLVHLALFAMAGAVFLRRPMSGPVFALALAGTGLVCIRLLLGVSALASYPTVQEGQQIGLWLLPLVPWVVVAVAEAARPGAARPHVASLRGWRTWIFHAVYAALLVALAAALFPASPAKQGVLGLVPAVVMGLWMAARSGWRPSALATGVGERLAAARKRHPRLLHGWSLGLALLALRMLLEGAGWREQVTVGGTRIGVSVFYTPLVVVVLAGLMWLHDRRIRAASSRDGGAGVPAAVAGALLEVGGFLVLAYVAVSAWVSDFGIALVALPGALVLLALLGALRAPAGRTGRATVLALSFPLLLFGLVQAAPPLLRFAWGGEVPAEAARMGEWNRNELLLLERGDPSALRMIGQRRSEALAVMRETMRSYTRGNLTGKGFLQGRVSDEIGETATREHAVSALLASQWGLPGVLGLALALLALLPPGTAILARSVRPRDGPEGPGPAALWTLAIPFAALLAVAFVLPSPFNALVVGLVLLAGLVVLVGPAFGVAVEGWRDPVPVGEAASPAEAGGEAPLHRMVGALALYTVALAGVYMILANYGLAFFTGKNVYLLGLDSVGDALEAVALLGLAALALGVDAEPWPDRATGDENGGEGGVAVATTAPHDEWWKEEGGR